MKCLKNKNLKFISIFLLSFLIAASAISQEKKLPDTKEKSKTISKISKLLKENYIFPQTAEKISVFIKQKLDSKAYDTISDPRAFADMLTNDLQLISKDRHLRVRFNPEDAKRLKQQEREGPDPEQEKRFLQMMKSENFGFEKVEKLSGNIGYVDFRYFGDSKYIKETVASVMAFLANTDAIIFDLRFNGGGSPDGIRLISSYLFGDKPVHLNDLYFRPEDRTEEFWTLRKVDGKKMPDVPVYILTSSYTFSGAEEFSYNLKNLKRAVIVGETTGGGAHPGGLVAVNDKYVIFMPTGRAINPVTKTNWEGMGVSPDIPAASEKALETAQVLALNRLSDKAKDQQTKNLYSWIAESIQMAMNAPVIDDKTLQSYVGIYGDRIIIYEGGKLYYQRNKRQKFLMTPISENTFMFSDIEFFRLRIDKDENGNITGVTGLYVNGDSDHSARSN